ncbi:MAG TPA: sulfurtransferase TusA family protein [Stellaceae bacterium]|nr:sulfurtransferase TusA family protein [Stellaceae bacterium]
MSEPVILDATGLKCPLPVLKARKAMRDLPEGGLLRVIATDPGAAKDFEHFCSTAGHRLVAQHEAAGVLTFDIRKEG